LPFYVRKTEKGANEYLMRLNVLRVWGCWSLSKGSSSEQPLRVRAGAGGEAGGGPRAVEPGVRGQVDGGVWLRVLPE
jgi:hypothetical protein